MSEKFGFSCWQTVGIGVANLGEVCRLRDGCDHFIAPFDKQLPTADLVNYILDHVRLGRVVRDEAARVCYEHNAEPTTGFLDHLVRAWDEGRTK